MALKKPNANTEAKQEVQVEPEVQEEVQANVQTEEVTATTTELVDTATGPGTSIAASAAQGGVLESELAADGFEGMEVGFYSFMTVKIAPEGHFQNAEKEDLGKSLKVNLLESKAKYSYTPSNDDEKVEFSYDQVTNTKGEQLAPIFNEWRAEGSEVNERKGVDIMAEVVEGELEGEIVILSVSKSGIAKITGHMGKLRRKGIDYRDVVTEVSVGTKVTSTKFDFYPWKFALAK